MGRAMIEGKCGLPTLPRCLAEATTPAKTDRAPLSGVRLGTTIMRLMIGRYKGFRCAHRGEGVKVDHV